MTSSIVLSTLGPDRPGIVDGVTRAATAHNLNIERSRMGVMGQEFSLVVLMSGATSDVEKFLNAIDEVLNPLGLDWVVRPTGNSAEREMGPAISYYTSITAIDAVGLVSKLTSVLHQLGANIEDLETSSVPAPESGTPIFHLAGRVLIPSNVKLESVRTALFELADDANFDLSFEPA